MSAPASTASLANKFLGAGLAGLAVTALGLFVSPAQHVALSYLVGVAYWVAISVGMLLLILIHHLTDAGWSTVIRRQYEHGISAFKWLFVLFLPLLISAWVKPGLVWPWMDLGHTIHGGHTVGADPLYLKKAGFLNLNMFTGMTLGFFAVWTGLAWLLRKASFSQDQDGDAKWTFMNRRTAAGGIVLTALSLTFAAIYWMKSLEYHWFSTMYGVWFFANCVRGGLAFAVFITCWLYARGDYKGIFNTGHFHALVALAFAFVVFWGYVTFSQYFLIWNANVPEETFWYNIRESGDWWYVGMLILFGHFFVPFLAWLYYPFKSNRKPAAIISGWVAFIILVDLCYNVLPALKDAHDEPLPFLSINLLWVLTSVIGVGGVCVWSYLRSLPTAKLIPIRDPRIVESLTHHDATAPEPGAASAH
ncbi:hypothetical protein [Opitutus sp. GAS368]|uniref:hypothetical protein n=1 Tax=Opitutus sp. GAS368 TaxID=1882749 RepID=UPI00087B6C67|nr:hypothetical protein [Opitutus sp. GAS368]SDS28018.1 hypothetical protein SAMN05444173_2412 [Opitutus sp. GAS368]